MNVWSKTLPALVLVVGTSAVAHAGVRYAGPGPKANDEFVRCIATNAGRTPVTIKIEVLDANGVTLAEDSGLTYAAETNWVETKAPTAILCRFTTSGSTKTMNGTLAILENDLGTRTRAVIPAQ